MFPAVNPTTTTAWSDLKAHYATMKNIPLKDLFAGDPGRFDRYHKKAGDILFDYSKNHINEQTIALLMALANASGLKDAIEAMFNGEKINRTENRAVLHTALEEFFRKTRGSGRKRCDARRDCGTETDE